MPELSKVLCPKPMTKAEFRQLSEFIYRHCGIKMPAVKKTMLEARLQKRLRSLGLGSYKDYCEHLFQSARGEEEYVHMIDCVTTNKTDFFREPEHFRFLANVLLPEYMKNPETAGRPFKIWSAACSTGEEPYTLAMVLSDFSLQQPGFHYTIFATDISTKVLAKASMAVYDEELTAVIPLPMKQRYLLRGKDRVKRLVRIAPEIRVKVQFSRANLMDERLVPSESMDVIFCRNVMIYFDRETQRALLGRLCGYLKPQGHLFLGHSETIHGFDLPVRRITSTIYRKTG